MKQVPRCARDDKNGGRRARNGEGRAKNRKARAGFDTFTKPLPVLWRQRWNATGLLKPPYRGKIDTLIRSLSGAKG